ncbi:hypothetical protein Ancab_006388 [Ancistrocladus abbreviatus]
MAPLLVLFTVLLSTLFICFLFYSRIVKPKTEFQKVFDTLPAFLLNLNHFPTNFAQDITKYTRLVKVPGLKILFTADPVIMQHTSSTNFHDFHRGPGIRDACDALGESIFNLDGNEWAERRKIYRSFFNIKEFSSLANRAILDKVERSLVPVLDHFASPKQGPQATVDLQELFQRFSFDTTCCFGLGYDPKTLSVPWPEEVPVVRAVEDLTEVVISGSTAPPIVWKLQRWLGIGKEQMMNKTVKILDDFTSQQLSWLHEERQKGCGERYCLLMSYISQSKADEKIPKDEALALILAGKGTVSATLTWFFLFLAEHPSAEAKIRQEIQDIIPDDDVNKFHLFNTKELSKLVYLQAALCEILRLFLPVPNLVKGSYGPRVLPTGHRVGPNTLIVLSLRVMGRLTSVWGKDSLEFKPERWITEKGEPKHEPAHKFPAFNAGPRICLGKDVAFMETKAVAATIVHNYNVQIARGQDTRPTNAIIVKMKDELRATISKRWS